MNLADIKDASPYMLSEADFANCGTPDSRDSEGAKFLTGIRDSFVELFESQGTVSQDDVSDITDGAVDYRTHAKWLQFVDLAAYQEESELTADGTWGTSSLDEAADMALAQIADRLAYALIAMVASEESDDEE